MTSKSFNAVPANAPQPPAPFTLHIEEEKLQEFKTLVKLSPIAKETFENKQDEGGHGVFGVSRKWIVDAKKYWVEQFDWRKEEDYINSFANFKSTISDDDGQKYEVHFAALFSNKSDAIPIGFYHGWPGSFLEFLPMMDILRKKYTPDTLPYHIIVPSLIGYGLSSGPPLNKNWHISDTTRIMHKLMLSLGFGTSGYLAQGGDVGSAVARTLAVKYAECKGIHLNFMYTNDIESLVPPENELSEADKKKIKAMTGLSGARFAYAMEHGTRPSTIGIVLASSPIAELAWIGEKFLEWTDPSTTPSVNTILTGVSLYWLTGCYPTSLYPYRSGGKFEYVHKPIGCTSFPYELDIIPQVLMERTGNVVYFKEHEAGGHFAALERPQALLDDVEEWAKIVWK